VIGLLRNIPGATVQVQEAGHLRDDATVERLMTWLRGGN